MRKILKVKCKLGSLCFLATLSLCWHCRRISNLIMNKTCVDSEVRQQVLAEQASNTKEAYEQMLQENLLEDKKLRENKYFPMPLNTGQCVVIVRRLFSFADLKRNSVFKAGSKSTTLMWANAVDNCFS